MYESWPNTGFQTNPTPVTSGVSKLRFVACTTTVQTGAALIGIVPPLFA